MSDFFADKRYYRPPNQAIWEGRRDENRIERFFQIVSSHSILLPLNLRSSFNKIALLGFCSDEGVRLNQGRIGAKEGPLALRQSLANYPLHGKAITMELLDMGDILCPKDQLAQAQMILGKALQNLVQQNIFTIVLGGGHETAFGHYLGLKEQWGDRNLAIVNFDAHFDMRPLLHQQHPTSGTPFLQIAQLRHQAKQNFDYYCVGINAYRNTQALFETAHQWHVKYLTCDEIYSSQEYATLFLNNIIQKHDVIYVSICLDVFAGSIAPGVSSVSPYGLFPWQVIPLLRQLALSQKVIALDVVELAPCYDKGNLTANLGALLIAEFLYHRAEVINA